MATKVSLVFSYNWAMSRKDDKVLPVSAFIAYLRKSFSVKVLKKSFTKCDFVIEQPSCNGNDLARIMRDILKREFSVENPDSIVEFTIEECVDEEKPATPPISAPKSEPMDISEIDNEEASAEEADAARLQKTIDKINALIGADEFKKLADECVKVAPGLIKHKVLQAFTSRCYIFAINDGDGLSTYLELFAELLDNLKLFNFDRSCKVVEEKLPPPQSRDRGDGSSLRSLQRISGQGSRVKCIDISEWMNKLTDKNFRDFLTGVYDHLGEQIYVFRVPFVEREILDGICRNIADVLSVREISFVPFDRDELTECARKAIANRGFTIEEDALEVLNARITEEKNDGRFYGINTVNKVVDDMIYRKQLSNADDGVDDTIIKKSEILGLAASYDEQEESGLEVLDGLIGMEGIRKRVEEIVAQIEMSIKKVGLGSPCIHMRFVGNPGTGKTTVARVIGKILREKGILRNGNFFEYFGRDFCGRYIGETAPKTSAMCRDAYGSVMFIDEAYSLYRTTNSGADYGREAIDTLIAEMENHRTDLVVIMAGYPDEMDTLMKANAGLESRMPYVIEFPNYTREQLYDIFMLMVNKNFMYQEGFEEAVKEYFLSLPEDVVSAKEFSNARFVRNLFERTWGKAVLRAQLNKLDASVLTKEDFLLSTAEKEFKKIMAKPNRSLGFV